MRKLIFILLVISSVAANAQGFNGWRQAASAVDLTTGLSLYYPLENGSGNAVTDASSSANDGTINGTANWISGKVGSYAVSFDGSNNYISLANSTAISPGTGNFTLSLWINFGRVGGTDQWIYADYGSNDNNLILLRMSGSNLNGYIRDGAGNAINISTTSLTLSLGVWYHIVLVKSGTSATLYVNNAIAGSDSNASLGTINTADGAAPRIGAYPLLNQNNLDARIDAFRFYNNRALGTGEIAALYNGGAGQ